MNCKRYTPGHFGVSLRDHPSMATNSIGILQNFKDGIIIKADGGNIFVTPLSSFNGFAESPHGNS